ncbi:MAG: exodeoxyribonuclease VII small subunit [Anaerolineae bacterium]|nr:exodeoxyribonuclease VII small subunit [Anaerolineae bacterium]
MAKNAANEITRLGYEQAFAELEQIVTRLETESSTLEESLLLFERGQELSKRCNELLEQADLKVKKLMGSSDRLDEGE